MTNLLDIIHIDVYSPLYVAICDGFFLLYMLCPEIWVNISIYLLNKEEVWNIWKMFKGFQDGVENIEMRK